MIILDTNVLSALINAKPDPIICDWLDALNADSICITSVNLFECNYGIKLLEQGKKRSALEIAFDRFVSEFLNNRILHLDKLSAAASARLAAARKQAGRPVDIRDTFIAGIAIANRATVATRNAKHFDEPELHVINPWVG